MSRAKTWDSANWLGTRPWAMCRARPSAMAVLPTPGSPTRMGLFLRLRASTWMVRSSSAARPMSGSMPPARALAVRSRVNSSRGFLRWVCSGLPPGRSWPSSSAGPASWGRPWEIYSSTSSRETPWPVRKNTAKESSSSNMAAMTSPTSTSSLPEDCFCHTARCMTRRTLRVCTTSLSVPVGRASMCSVKKPSSWVRSLSTSAPQASRMSELAASRVMA